MNIYYLFLYEKNSGKNKKFMQLILSMLFVVASFIGCFVLAGGALKALVQPFEMLMLGGSAIGFLFAGNDMFTIKKMGRYLKYSFNSPYSPEKFSQLLGLMFALTKVKNAIELNNHLIDYSSSDIFAKYPLITNDEELRIFVCNNFLLYVDNGRSITSFAFEDHLEREIEEHHHDSQGAYKSIAALVDTMPALGICAAVLGIIISMGYLDAPMEELGHHIGAALFGTFFGVFLAYGIFKPISLKFAKVGDASTATLRVTQSFLVSLMKGYDPLIAAIITNKSVPPKYRLPDHELKQGLMKGEI